MDGGRRFLRSLRERLAAPSAPHAFAAAVPMGGFTPAIPAVPRSASRQTPAPARPARSRLDRLTAIALTPGVNALALAILLGGPAALGFVNGGGYDRLIAEEGAPGDIAARAIGFPISAVTISGQAQLRENEILAAAGVDPRASLLFLDAAEVRKRLMQLALVKDARVMKFYPDRLVISLTEREPAALWQMDGALSIIAADGTVIDRLNDQRFLGLPFVVGENAGKRLPEFLALLNGMGDLASRVKAGVLVSNRRWSLQMKNGVEVKLPERDPGAAVGLLLRLQREARVLDKDLMSIDLRLPDRVAVRLTEEGAAALAAASPHKAVKSGGKT
ncbi:MAG TPA: cell division protein FtsQ/DivIB [Methylocystis sp.]|nr:cell division protein FtsQ/DivIB [Methylocystis sp.]